MKENLSQLAAAVRAFDNKGMNVMFSLLEKYNDHLSGYVIKRELTRLLMDAIDTPYTLSIISVETGLAFAQSVPGSMVALDLNTLARSTWYFEKEDGTIYTGDDLYKNKCIYAAWYHSENPVYPEGTNMQKVRDYDDFVEQGSMSFRGPISVPLPPEPIGYEKVLEEISGYENPACIEEMVALIKWHAMVMSPFLKQ